MATTYDFITGTITGRQTAVQKNRISDELHVLRGELNCAYQTINAGEADVAQVIAIPAGTTVLSCFARVITAETADGSIDLGYGSDADYWGSCLHVDATGTCNTVLTGSTTWDAGSIADGDEEAQDVTVVGVALGDPVLVTMGVDVADLVVQASVTAEDTVTVLLANNTGGAIDLASTTVEVMILKAPRAAAPLYFATADTIDITASVVNGDVDLDGAKIEVVAVCVKHAI